MTARDVNAQDMSVSVQVRTDGDVNDAALGYIRAKVDAALDRPGLPAVSGRVTITRAAAHHILLPWSARAEIQVGSHLVLVHAREADEHALADRLEDRMRAQVERAVHRAESARRSAGPPPWRGGATDGGDGQGDSATMV
jgi:hypothetical protein